MTYYLQVADTSYYRLALLRLNCLNALAILKYNYIYNYIYDKSFKNPSFLEKFIDINCKE